MILEEVISMWVESHTI